MEFVERIKTPKVDGVVLHRPFQQPVNGTLCITGHHLILSSRMENQEELWACIFMCLIKVTKCHRRIVASCEVYSNIAVISLDAKKNKCTRLKSGDEAAGPNSKIYTCIIKVNKSCDLFYLNSMYMCLHAL